MIKIQDLLLNVQIFCSAKSVDNLEATKLIEISSSNKKARRDDED